MDNINKPVMAVISVLLMVILVAVVVVPVVESSQQGQSTTYTNDYTYRMLDNPSGEYDITVNKTTGVVSVNGVVIQSTLTDNEFGRTTPVLVSDNVYIYVYKYSTSHYLAYQDATQVVMTATEIVATFNNGTLGFDITLADETTDTESYAYTFGLVASNSGSYGYYGASQAFNVNTNKTVYLFAATYNANISEYGIAAKYTNNATTIFGFTAKAGATIDGITWDITPVASEQFNTITSFTAQIAYTYNETPGTVDVSASSGKIAPIDYTVVTPNDSMIVQMLSIIPLLLFIVPIMVIVGLYGRRE